MGAGGGVEVVVGAGSGGVEVVVGAGSGGVEVVVGAGRGVAEVWWVLVVVVLVGCRK